MTPINTNIVIERLPNGKKTYRSNGDPLTPKQAMPKGWQSIPQPTEPDQRPIHEQALIIRCDDDLIVIDCDDEQSTQDITALTTPTYTTISDKGYKHFYYTPTQYYLDSPLAGGKNRVAIADPKIDILQNKTLVFTAHTSNHTREVHGDPTTPIAPIPNEVVDYLVSKKAIDPTNASLTDYRPVQGFIQPQLRASLDQYKASRDYNSSLATLFAQITPYKFRRQLREHNYHPNFVPDGQGTEYVQALSSKIAGDPSIDEYTHRELITVITTQLWEDPWDAQRVDDFLSNLTTQTYSKTGQRVWQYDPDVSDNVMMTLNKGKAPYTALYHSVLDDSYFLPLPTGEIMTFRHTTALKNQVRTKNTAIRHGNTEYHHNQVPQLTELVESVKPVYKTYAPHGTQEAESGIIEYNTYIPSKYVAIIRGEYTPDNECPVKECPPTIQTVLDSITADHSTNRYNLQTLLHRFIARKLKTYDHSPIIFHTMGAGGTGKDVWFDLILSGLVGVDATGVANLNENQRFNSDYATKIFVKSPEVVLTLDVVNKLKDLSGSRVVKVEPKGKDAYTDRNVATYILSSNHDKMASSDSANDRRNVLLLSFSAPQLSIDNLDIRIAQELEEYAIFLRDIEPLDNKYYNNAKPWLDDAMKQVLDDSIASSDNIHKKLHWLIKQAEAKDIAPADFRRQLEDLLDMTTWWVKASYLYIVVTPAPGKDGYKDLESQLSKSECNTKLKEYMKLDRNRKRAASNYHYLKVALAYKYIEELKKPVGSLGDTDKGVEL